MNIPLHAQAIRAAGGRSQLARTLGVSSETVKDWPKRGIPAKYWHRVVALAIHNLPDLTIEALDQSKPDGRAAQQDDPQRDAAD